MAIDPDIAAAFSGATPAPAQANIDPDIAAAFQNQGEPAGLHAPSSGSEHLEGALQIGMRHPFTVIPGLAENALTGITGAVGRTLQRMGGEEGTYQGYQPHLEAGKELQQLGAQEGQRVGGLATQGMTAAGMTPEQQASAKHWFGVASDVAGTAGPVLGGFNMLRGALTPAAGALAGSPQSIGAAASANDVTGASPELQAVVKDMQSRGAPINQDVLARHVEAESLPVPAKLTKGQATQDPVLFSNEQNLRLKNEDFSKAFNAQNQNLVDNLQAIRENVGPDVFSTNKVEHGDTLIKAYKEKAAAADAITDQKYQALRDANGGQFPLDAPTLQANVTNALHDQMLFEHAPAAEMAQLQRASEAGSMPFSRFEAMRTNLARIARTSGDGNERAAAGVIRQEMEKLPLTGDMATLKPLADDARATARAQFRALDADPAYKAAVNETVPPDKFVNRFIINGNRDDVALMRQNLAHDPTATQTMSVAALDHLRDSASLSDSYQGTFRQAGYNKHLQALDPKMSTLFGPQDAGDIRALGNVARNQMQRPAGAAVNESNTATTLMGQRAKGILEGVADVKTGGLYSGIAKPLFKARAARKLAEEHLATGAGLDYPAK